jgi:hypothetical protein
MKSSSATSAEEVHRHKEIIMAVRQGSGAVVKYFKLPSDSMAKLMDEVNELTDTDLTQLADGIKDGSLNY